MDIRVTAAVTAIAAIRAVTAIEADTVVAVTILVMPKSIVAAEIGHVCLSGLEQRHEKDRKREEMSRTSVRHSDMINTCLLYGIQELSIQTPR